MKRVWYLYQNDINYGQRERGIDAVKEVYTKAGKSLSKEKLIALVQKGYCAVGEFKASKETLKV